MGDRWTSWGLFVSGLVFGQGCCPKYDCLATNTLVIRDKTGAILGDTSGVLLDPESPSACSASESCSFRIFGGGDYSITYHGLKVTTVHIEDVKDGCGNYVNQTITVDLVAESGNEAAVPKHTQGASCGD